MIHKVEGFILVDDDYDADDHACDNGDGMAVDEMVVPFEEASVCSKCSNDCNRTKIVPVV